MTKASTKKTAAPKPDPKPDPESADLDRQQEQFETINPTTAAADIPQQLPSGPPWFIAYDGRLLRYVSGWYASEATARRAAQAQGVPAGQITVESYEPTAVQSVGRTPQ